MKKNDVFNLIRVESGPDALSTTLKEEVIKRLNKMERGAIYKIYMHEFPPFEMIAQFTHLYRTGMRFKLLARFYRRPKKKIFTLAYKNLLRNQFTKISKEELLLYIDKATELMEPLLKGD